MWTGDMGFERAALQHLNLRLDGLLLGQAASYTDATTGTAGCQWGLLIRLLIKCSKDETRKKLSLKWRMYGHIFRFARIEKDMVAEGLLNGKG